MFRTGTAARCLPSSSVTCRLYSQLSPAKLVGELRKHTEVSITKAREALAATNNDLQRALEWIQQDLAASGARKAEKVAGRVAGEGLLAVSVLSEGWGVGRHTVRAAMIELNCETDFVARSENFNSLAANIAYTTAYLSEPPLPAASSSFMQSFPLDVLRDAPLLSKTAPPTSGTVVSAIQEAISKVGEKIDVRRAVSFVCDPLALSTAGMRVGSYVHGGQTGPDGTQTGRIASLVAVGIKSSLLSTLKSSKDFQTSFGYLSRSLARQVVGLDTRTIRSSTPSAGSQPDFESTELYSQPFVTMMNALPDETVEAVLRSWAKDKGLGEEEGTGVEVLEFVKWTAGEGIERTNDFAEEVRRLSGAV